MRAMIMVAVAALGLASCGPTKEELAIKKAREWVALALVDPGSAQFQFEVVGPDAVCGTVTGRNRLGGMGDHHSYVVPMVINDSAQMVTGQPVILGVTADVREFVHAEKKCPGPLGDIARGV